MTALERLGAHVARGVASDRVSAAVSLHVADALGAWLAGCGTQEGKALLELHQREHDLAARVALHCALARLSEIDDIHLASGTTPGGVIVPAALVIGGALGASGQALARAVLVGYEAMVRLGRAIDGASVLYRGIWPTYLAAPFAVAAAAAHLLSLDENQAAHALGIALTRGAPGVGHQTGKAISRWWALGRASAEGLRAALAAQAGLTADLHILEGEFFRSIYAITPDVGVLTRDFGGASAVSETSFKPWCAARQTMAAAQALIELEEEGVATADALEVTAFVPPPYWKMVNHGVAAGDRASHLTSLPYQVALAACERDARFDAQQSPDTISSRCAELMVNVKVRADESLLAHYPRAWPARVAVKARGETREKLVLHVPGDPERPFGEREVLAKFQRFVAPLLGERAARALATGGLGVLRDEPTPSALFTELQDTML